MTKMAVYLNNTLLQPYSLITVFRDCSEEEQEEEQEVAPLYTAYGTALQLLGRSKLL